MLEELDGLVIQRTAPKSLFLGQKTWVTISLENKGDREKNIDFSERLQAADFDESQAKYIETDYGEKFWYYQWKIKLPGGEKTTLAYEKLNMSQEKVMQMFEEHESKTKNANSKVSKMLIVVTVISAMLLVMNVFLAIKLNAF